MCSPSSLPFTTPTGVFSRTQVVRPTHYADGCFACYTNFVPKLTR